MVTRELGDCEEVPEALGYPKRMNLGNFPSAGLFFFNICTSPTSLSPHKVHQDGRQDHLDKKQDQDLLQSLTKSTLREENDKATIFFLKNREIGWLGPLQHEIE